jgi:hypothetical protein
MASSSATILGMHVLKFVVVSVALASGASLCQAGTTPWMSQSQLETYAKSKMVGKVYATSISCKDSDEGPLLKFETAAFPKGYVKLTGIDLFFRWNWLITKAPDLAKSVAKMPRKEKRQLKWRVVQKNSYVDASGVAMTCAIVYR